jgi:hypothetical protein
MGVDDMWLKEAHEKIMLQADTKNILNRKSAVITLLKRKEYGQASEILVEVLEERFHIYTTRDDKSSEMWIYKDGIYVPQGKSIIREFLRQIMGEEYNVWLANQVISKIETDTQIEPQEFFSTNHIYEIPTED